MKLVAAAHCEQPYSPEANTEIIALSQESVPCWALIGRHRVNGV